MLASVHNTESIVLKLYFQEGPQYEKALMHVFTGKSLNMFSPGTTDPEKNIIYLNASRNRAESSL
jgi:hypothetical protein